MKGPSYFPGDLGAHGSIKPAHSALVLFTYFLLRKNSHNIKLQFSDVSYIHNV